MCSALMGSGTLYPSKKVFMTFAQILLIGYLVFSFVAAIIVYAACAMASRQSDQPDRPQSSRLHRNQHVSKPQFQPMARPALLQQENLSPLEHTPATFKKIE